MNRHSRSSHSLGDCDRADPGDPPLPSLANPRASLSRFEPSNTTLKYYLVMH